MSGPTTRAETFLGLVQADQSPTRYFVTCEGDAGELVTVPSVTVEIPSLADREEDLPDLARFYLDRAARERGSAITRPDGRCGDGSRDP